MKRGRGHLDPYYVRALIDPKSSRIPAHRPPRVSRLNPPAARPQQPTSRKPPDSDREAAIDPPAKKSRAGGKRALSDAAVREVITLVDGGVGVAEAARRVSGRFDHVKKWQALERAYYRHHVRIRKLSVPELSVIRKNLGPGRTRKA